MVLYVDLETQASLSGGGGEGGGGGSLKVLITNLYLVCAKI